MGKWAVGAPIHTPKIYHNKSYAADETERCYRRLNTNFENPQIAYKVVVFHNLVTLLNCWFALICNLYQIWINLYYSCSVSFYGNDFLFVTQKFLLMFNFYWCLNRVGHLAVAAPTNKFICRLFKILFGFTGKLVLSGHIGVEGL